MHKIAAFGEDHAHRMIVGTLVQRLARCCGVDIEVDWRNASGGHGRVVSELRRYLKDLTMQRQAPPDLIIVATDANCKGFNERVSELMAADISASITFAVPDPHIERWLLLDGRAFRTVFGKGCDAPDQKCDRDRYKDQLRSAIHNANADIKPPFGGIEYAEDIVKEIDIRRASGADSSFRSFVDSIRSTFRGWRT